MAEEPFLSIVMPVYNGENEITSAVNSILKQSFEDWELIIVDDCSIDSTRQVAESIAVNDARIRIILQETNQGPGAAKNRGIAEAKGEYITFCDCDDWIELDMYEGLCRAAKSKGVDSVICGYSQDIVDASTETVKTQKRIYMESGYILGHRRIIENIPDIDIKRVFSFSWNKLYKKAIISNYNIVFSGKMFGEDLDFNINFFRYANSIVILEECYYHYVKRSNNSLTERYIADFYENICERYRDMRALLIQNNCFNGRARFIAATVHIKHIMAALIRNCSPDACMKYKDRYLFTKKILNDFYTKEACQYARAETKQGKICNGICKSKSIMINLAFARMLYIIQNLGTGVFQKLK